MNDRIAFLDYMRAMACLMVIFVHSCEFFYIGDSGIDIKTPGDGVWVCLIDSAFRCSVPLFVMISAYLLVPVREPTGTFFGRRLVRVVIPFVVWSLLYAVLPCLWGAATAGDVVDSVVRLAYNFNDASGHMWFIYMLVGVYLVMPVISPWLEKVSRRDELIFLAVWFISTFLPYLREAVGPVFGECFWNEFNLLWYYSGFIGYVVLAHYVRTRLTLTPGREFAAGAALFAAGYCVTALVWYGRVDTSETIRELELSWRFCTPNVAMTGLGAFLMVKALFGNVRHENGLVRQISEMSYGMYLMHIFILGFVFSVANGHFATPVTIVIVAVTTYAVCFAITRLLSFLPGSKYVIG